ncbi:hypothetical protein [Streptomyces sp. MUM 178J]|uniref:hypothetical protein n=1 Tax=Streptomyces sp. MUM 178J TaxID=2791991 RepID=UPI001F042609|nr:hypothetical protein [Streptomyces sp. MUM 178J]WRQ79167.1 hypothetical protein I3F59_007130 [Streptomyces sp. MUM 178J]
MRRLSRAAAGLAAAVALSLAAGGCVTVHGERAVVPAVTKDEATQALQAFTKAYNAADKAYDPALDAHVVTGSLGAINQAGLASRQVNYPEGNPSHRPLELADTRFVIPKKAGWPRWFIADTDSNRDEDGGDGDTRWLLAFIRTGPDQTWRAAYLSVLAPDEIPAFTTDEEGYAEPVAADSSALAVAPGELSEQYAGYLQSGKPARFKDGPYTSAWRAERKNSANLPGISTQYRDRAANEGDFAPLGLATEDGGAFVLFSMRSFERQTAAKGVRLKVHPDVQALLSGEVTSTLTKERVSSQAVTVPAAGAGGGAVEVLGRLAGLTSAKGS